MAGWVFVTFVYCVETTERILTHFSSPGSHTILVILYQTLWQYSNTDLHQRGREMQVGYEKNQDFLPISRFIS